MEEMEMNRLPLIGDPAPAFKALTTKGTVNFPEDYKGKWVLFFRIRPISRPCAPQNL